MEKQTKKDECCPICGYNNANARRIKTPDRIRNKSTWLYCEECGMLVHG